MNEQRIKECVTAIIMLFPDEYVNKVNVLSINNLEDNAYFIRVELHFAKDCDEMTIPVIYYDDAEWVFTPVDWQGWLPVEPEDIDRIEWMINTTGTKALNLNGLPRVPFWVNTY